MSEPTENEQTEDRPLRLVEECPVCRMFRYADEMDAHLAKRHPDAPEEDLT